MSEGNRAAEADDRATLKVNNTTVNHQHYKHISLNIYSKISFANIFLRQIL